MTETLNIGIRCGCGNSALIVLVPTHPNVATFAPRCSPAIFHQPVVDAVFGAIANHSHGVVGIIGNAVGFVVDPLVVKLERRITSIDAHCHWTSVCHSVLQRCLAVLNNIDILGDGCANCVWIEATYLSIISITSVWIRCFGVDSAVFDDVL